MMKLMISPTQLEYVHSTAQYRLKLESIYSNKIAFRHNGIFHTKSKDRMFLSDDKYTTFPPGEIPVILYRDVTGRIAKVKTRGVSCRKIFDDATTTVKGNDGEYAYAVNLL